MNTLPIEVPDSMIPHARKVVAGEYAPPAGMIDPASIKTVLDLGANVGSFTYWARQQFPLAPVTAVEPEPENASIFRRNFAGDKNVRLIEAAVWPIGEPVTMRIGANNCGEHSVFDLGEQTSQCFTAKAVSPALLPKADFVKIDIEGAEMCVVNGYDFSRTKVVSLEWHRPVYPQPIIEALKTKGFTLVRSDPSRPDRGIMVFVRNDLVKESSEKKKIKLFIGLPVYGGYDPHFSGCLHDLLVEPPVTMVLRSNVGDSLVSRARNNIVADFLKTDCTHLLFIDTDLIFSADHITRLLSHDLPLVTGVYPKKQTELAWVYNPLPDEVEDENGLIKVKHAATGFMLIRRGLIERMIEQYPDIEYDDDDNGGVKHDLFQVGVVNRRYLSEDWYFCHRAREMGVDVIIDTRVVLKHVGKAIYPISLDAYEPA